MKKNMLLLAWLMAAGMPVLAQNAYLENLKLENRTVEKADGKVRVQADICLDGVDLKRQQSLRLVPVLVSADGTQEALLPAVVVEGRVRGKVTDRQLALGERTEEAGGNPCAPYAGGAPDIALRGGGALQPLDGERPSGSAWLRHRLCRL